MLFLKLKIIIRDCIELSLIRFKIVFEYIGSLLLTVILLTKLFVCKALIIAYTINKLNFGFVKLVLNWLRV